MTGKDGSLRVALISSHAQVVPGLIVYRFRHSLYYANAEFLTLQVLELVNSETPHLTWFCLDAIAVDDIDFTAAETLKYLFALLKEKNIRFVMTDAESHVYAELERSDLLSLFGKDTICRTSQSAIQAYRLISSEDEIAH